MLNTGPSHPHPMMGGIKGKPVYGVPGMAKHTAAPQSLPLGNLPPAVPPMMPPQMMQNHMPGGINTAPTPSMMAAPQGQSMGPMMGQLPTNNGGIAGGMFNRPQGFERPNPMANPNQMGGGLFDKYRKF